MTYEELIANGGQPVQEEEKAPTFEELVAQGGQAEGEPAPAPKAHAGPPPETFTKTQSALLGAAQGGSLGLAPRVLALEDAQDAVLGPRKEIPIGSMGDAIEKIKQTVGRNVGMMKNVITSPVETFKKMGQGYDQALDKYRQGFHQSAQENPKSTFMGAMVPGLLSAPKTLAQAAGTGLAQGVGGTQADLGKAATGDINELMTLGKDAGLGAGMAGLGYKSPLAAAGVSGGMAAFGDKLGMSDADRQQAALGAAFGVGGALAKGIGKGVSNARTNALNKIRSGLEERQNKWLAEDAANVAKHRADLVSGKNPIIKKAMAQRENYLAGRDADIEALNNAVKTQTASEDARAKFATDAIKAGQKADYEAAKGDYAAKKVDLKAIQKALADQAKIDEGRLPAGRKSSVDLLGEKADAFEASIPDRVKSKEASEFGALINRMVNEKVLNGAIPEELNTAAARYKENSPEFAQKYLVKDPAALSKQYESDLMRDLAIMRAKAQEKAGPALKDVQYTNPNDVLKAAGLYEKAQQFPDYAQTVVKGRPIPEIAPFVKPEKPAPIPPVQPQRMNENDIFKNAGLFDTAQKYKDYAQTVVRPAPEKAGAPPAISPEQAARAELPTNPGRPSSLPTPEEGTGRVAPPAPLTSAADKARILEMADKMHADLDAGKGPVKRKYDASEFAPWAKLGAEDPLMAMAERKVADTKFGPVLKKSLLGTQDNLLGGIGAAVGGAEMLTGHGGLGKAITLAAGGKAASAAIAVAKDPALRAKMMTSVQNVLRYKPELANSYGKQLSSALARGEMATIGSTLTLAGQDPKFRQALEEEFAKGEPANAPPSPTVVAK